MKRILSLAVIATVTMMPAAHAAVSDEDFQQLREQLAAVSARLEQLAAENAELRAAQEESAVALSTVQESVVEVSAVESSAQVETWSDRVRLDGDFRYRYERIDPEGSDSRRRNRIPV